MQDTIAEVRSLESRQQHGADIGFNIAEGRLWFMLEALKESWQNLLLEIVSRVRLNNLSPNVLGETVKILSHYIITDTRINERNLCLFMLGNPDRRMKATASHTNWIDSAGTPFDWR